MVPSRFSGCTRQEWQVVLEHDRVPPGDGSSCRVIGEASYTTLCSHAGPLHKPAVSLLQQSARNLLQQGYVCSAKSSASNVDTRVAGHFADTNAGPSTNSESVPSANSDELTKAAPLPSGWELL